MDYKTITKEHLTLEKQSYVRDIESYPNFFSNTFKTKNEKFVFEISERRNDIIPLLNFLKNVKVLYGVNSKKYDSLVEAHILSNQNFVTMNYKDICKSINECSQNLINDNYAIIRTLQKVELPFKDIDIKEVSAVFKSLKLVGVSLKHNWIQDLPFPFDKVVEVDEIPHIVKEQSRLLSSLKILEHLEKKFILKMLFSIM